MPEYLIATITFATVFVVVIFGADVLRGLILVGVGLVERHRKRLKRRRERPVKLAPMPPLIRTRADFVRAIGERHEQA